MSVTNDSIVLNEQQRVSIYAQYTCTTTGTGATLDLTIYPLKSFSLQAVGSGGTPTLWTAILEGSIDGVNFDTLATSTNVIGINVIVSLGSTTVPVRYIRPRITVLTLGGSSGLILHILGA